MGTTPGLECLEMGEVGGEREREDVEGGGRLVTGLVSFLCSAACSLTHVSPSALAKWSSTEIRDRG